MKTVTKVESSIPRMPQRKNVAAYARVSMETERLQHSLSAQISYYSELIQKHAGWQYVGVYADDGISGTKISRRDEFRRMVEDCEAGKIDIILTKSISRFARNTVDLLNTVRRLKELGVSVRFEKENIDSLSDDGELMLTLLASFAQEEIRSLSENVKWGTIKRFQKGIPNGQMRIFGYDWVDGQLTIIPDEADIIRWMYREYMKGASRIEIGRALNDKGIFTRQGKLWVDSNVKVVLTNITYTGNMLFQKEYTVDPITRSRKKNRGELPQFYVEDTHEPIIPMDEFQKVQAEFKRRRDLGPLGNKSLKLTAFSTRITCGQCGKHYRRSGKRNTAGELYYIWTCQTKSNKGLCACNSKSIPEKTLQNVTAAVIGLPEFDGATFLEQIEEIYVVSDDTLRLHFTDGREVSTTWESTAMTDWWTPERRRLWGERHKRKDTNPNKNTFYEFTGFIRCGQCGSNYRCQSNVMKDGTPSRAWYCSAPAGVCDKVSIKDATMKTLVVDVLGLDVFDETAMDKHIEYAQVLGNTVTFHFRDGHEEVRNFKDKRHGTKWSAERLEKQCQALKASWTDERRAAARDKKRKSRSEVE
ncbi:MAG: recombinase family protein [Christensenellales bacterium]